MRVFRSKYLLLLGVIMLMMTSGCNNNKLVETIGENVENIIFNGHTIVHKEEDLKKGNYNNIIYKSGALSLKDSSLTGTYTSPIINTKSFKELVGSWNAITPNKSFVELKIQVRQNNIWSSWFTYGNWGLGKINGSVSSQSDDIARMSIDTVIIKNGLDADAFKYSITLNRKTVDEESPLLKLIAVTLKFSENYVETIDLSKINWEKNVDVPVRSQMIVPDIGSVICSPTSLTMLMNKYNVEITPSETASSAKDYSANIYGNWSYNVAVAGALGLEAYVSRLSSIDELKLLISEDIPVAVSITVKESKELDGLPLRSDGLSVMVYPSGHLLVIRGFTVIDDIEYVIVNDPAARNNEEVNRQYKLDQFINVWKNYVYIVKE